MNFKTTYILFGVLVLAVLVFGLVLWLNPDKPPDTSYVIPSLHDAANPVKTDEIDTVEIRRTRPAEAALTFVRDSETKGWRMTQPLDLRAERVDRLGVDRLIDQVMNARKEEKTDVSGDLKQWGLEPAAATVTIKKGDKAWSINFGEERRSKEGATSVVYVTSSDRPKEPLTVKLNQVDAYAKAVPDFRNKDLLAEHAFDVQAVNLRDGKSQPVILQRQGSENRWRFLQPSFGAAEYETEQPPAGFGAPPPPPAKGGVRSLLESIAALKVEYKNDKENDFVAENARNLEQFGLEPGEKPGRLRIEVTRKTGGFGGGDKTVTDALLIGNKVDEKGEKVYARLESDNNVVKVSAANLKAVTATLENPSSLRDRDLVQIEENRIDAIRVKNSAGEMELYQGGEAAAFRGPEWKLFRDGPPTKADDAEVRKLLSAVTAKRQVKEFPDATKDDKALGLDQPSAVVSLWVDGIQKDDKKDDKKKEGTAKEGSAKEDKKVEDEEKKDPNAKPKLKSDEPTVRLTFGKRENGVVYVRRKTAEDNVVVAVPDTLFDTVSRGPLAYLDKSLPPFTGIPNRLVLERGGQTFEVEKVKESDKEVWKFKQPAELAGRTASALAVEDALSALRFLRADKLVAEKASPELEQQYGLKTPTLKVTVVAVAKDDKTEERVYLFGKEENDFVYGKLGDKDMIFQVRKLTLGPLQAELRDPTLFAFDRNKVKEMKLTGWKELLGNPQNLVLERKGSDDWAHKGGLDVGAVDGVKTESFLAGLANLKVEKFLNKAEAKPEKMDPKEGALLVEITVEGEKDPVTLTLGGDAAEGKSYYAQSNRLAGETFLVAKGKIEEVRKRPGYFSKAQ